VSPPSPTRGAEREQVWKGEKKMADEKLTVKRLIAAVVLTILAVLGWLYVMFLGLILTGNLMTAWILGLAYAVAVILLCAASTLRKKLTWRRVTA